MIHYCADVAACVLGPHSRIAWDGLHMEQGVNYRYNAQLDGRMASYVMVCVEGSEQDRLEKFCDCN